MALVNLHLKNLRIILLYKIILITLIITIGITLYRINKKENININEEKIIGKVINKTTNETTKLEIKSTEKIIVETKEEYSLGDILEIKGQIQMQTKNTVPNLFNYKNYLKSKKINITIKPTTIKIIKRNKSIKYKIKEAITNYIEKFQTRQYLKTFILGDNKEIDEQIRTSYQTNGISHLFAVSGMHLSLFSNILLFILKKINKKEIINYSIIVIFFIFFSFLTNYTPSILRALILYILTVINKILKLNIKTIYILIIDLIILLLYNPFFIYNTGFIYSFVITIALISNSKIINKQKTYIKKILLTSIISFIVSIPISINNFHEINLLSPLTNIIFVPFVSLIIFPLSLLTTIIKPLDPILNITIKILEYLSKTIEKFKITIILSHIPWYIIILYYLTIILFIKGIKNKKIKTIIPLILLIIVHTNIKYIQKSIQITYLDVDQGDSTLLELPQNKNILIDTGGKPGSKTSISISKTIPYLKSLGIKNINYLILTHGDFDHMGEAINLVNNFKVEKVMFNCGEYNDLEKNLIKVLDKKKIPYYSCIKELNIGKNKLHFLQTKEYDNENDNSNVIYTELNGYRFMFMGDASVTTEKEVLDKYDLPDIDVLKVGHHGSRTSSSKEFINEINPNYSIISVGKNNRYGHPNKEVLYNLEKSKIYRTDEDGSIMFKIKNNRLKIETCEP